MINIKDEQTTKTTIPEEPIPSGRITSPPDYQVQDETDYPDWEGYQETYDRQTVTVRSAIFGGLAGGIFFFGLAAAILSGQFWPVFLLALAMTSLVGSLSSAKVQAIYAGFQGCVFFLGLAALAYTGWWWPGILVVLGIAAILGIGSGVLALWPVTRPGMTVDQYYTALRDHDYARAYRFLDASLAGSLTQGQFTRMAQEQDMVQGTVSKYSIAPDLEVTTAPLPGEPFPEIHFTGNPAEHVIVTVRRTHAPSYMVHLIVRHVGRGWKISAFDRI